MTYEFRPQRARDTTEEELVVILNEHGTLIVMIKYDGVRCIVRNGVVYGKSMLPITNRYIQELYGKDKYDDVEFEIIVTHNGRYDPVTCCSETVSFTNSDYLEREHKCVIIDDSSVGRMILLERLIEVEWLTSYNPNFILPELETVSSLEEILQFEKNILEKDHEAIIIRNPFLSYKEGLSTKHGELLRLKRYISEEAIIIDVATSYTNTNKAELNALGYTERSSKLEGKVPKEEIGKLLCKTVKDIYDPWSRRLIFSKGSHCIIAPGNMTKDEKISLYKDKENLKGKMIVFKSFPKGTKDKPRFATFQHFVPEFDQP